MVHSDNEGSLGCPVFRAELEKDKKSFMWKGVEYQSNTLDQQYVNAIIPLIRLFKDNYLFEVGFGDLYFVTVMVHF